MIDIFDVEPEYEVKRHRKWSRMLDGHRKPVPEWPGTTHNEDAWYDCVMRCNNDGPRTIMSLERVNDFFNHRGRFPFKKDKLDRWLSLNEVLHRKRVHKYDDKDGLDCEDIAGAKYATLRHLGYTLGELRMLVVRDMRTRPKRGHAILVVRRWLPSCTGYEEPLILDNQIRKIKPLCFVIVNGRRGRYKPMFWLAENGWGRIR